MNGLPDPWHAEIVGSLERWARLRSLWQAEIGQALQWAAGRLDSAAAAMQFFHTVQRLNRIFAAGIENDDSFRSACDANRFPLWQEFASPPTDEKRLGRLADCIYNAKLVPGAVTMLMVDNGARRIGELILDRCTADGVSVFVRIGDPDFNSLALNHAADKGIADAAADFIARTKPVGRCIAVGAGLADGPVIAMEPQKQALWTKLASPFTERVMSGKLALTMTSVPSRKESEIEGIDYGDYLDLYLESCDQPWDQIGAAQERLISVLDEARTLRFTNNDGTDVIVGIDGFTFCNGLLERNVPGSEVYSGLERDRLHGTIVAKGRFVANQNSPAIVENLTMEFEYGRLVRWHADKGQAEFERVTGVDEGARYAGEIGIGTNPRLRRHLVNNLLVEKVGGSFHVALGNSYTFTEYAGKPVTVDNGNRSAIHWDITTLLRGKQGCIFVDGKKVMDDGIWLDPHLGVLNRGTDG